MNLVQLASHTVDLDLLPEAPRVLDAGCRDFDFSQAVLKVRPHARIKALDPGPDIPEPDDPAIMFFRAALVGDDRKRARLFTGSTGHGDFLSTLDVYYDMKPVEVGCLRIGEIAVCDSRDWPAFDLVKLDIEGSEFEILERWPGPIARQISVEFHDWNRPEIRDSDYYERLWAKLPWYRVVQHGLSKQGNGVGNWDSLLVLR